MLATFQEIGKLCGGLRSMDRKTLECHEIRWARLEVEAGDIRSIPHMISIVVDDKLFPVVISIKGEISLSWTALSPKVDRRLQIESPMGDGVGLVKKALTARVTYELEYSTVMQGVKKSKFESVYQAGKVAYKGDTAGLQALPCLGEAPARFRDMTCPRAVLQNDLRLKQVSPYNR